MRTLVKVLHGCLRASNAVAFVVMVTAMGGCSMIDEDLSDFGNESKIDYELELITNLSIELQTQLNMGLETNVSGALSEHLKTIFTDFAHDVDLSFYDTQGDSARLHHDQHIMDANQQSYTLYLPMREYMHLAAANVVDNAQVGLANDEHCHPSMLQQIQRDTITPHTTGLFTARLPMSMQEGKDQTFSAKLYMANCAAALVVDPRGYDTKDMQVFADGFASGFNICDSAFVFSERSSLVKADQLDIKNGSLLCFCSVNFPSREPKPTRSVIVTEEPFIAQPSDESLWEFRVYLPKPGSNQSRSGGSITETVLRVREPLRAGELKIIKGYVNDDGSVMTDSPEVGVSVTLDWTPGGVYHPNI